MAGPLIITPSSMMVPLPMKTFSPILKNKLVDLDLSVRALNCLKAADVETLGELVAYNRNDLLKFRNFGKKSLTELDELLENLGVSFGMDVSKYKLDKD
jgi:DNA-directed RNA polymerase subunit alpha